MKIRKKVNRDGEFDCFRFRFRQPPPEVAEALRGLFRDWMREREASDTCECCFKHLSVEKSVNPRQVDVLFGWFCDRCLPRLESAVNERLPSVTGLSVGNDLSPYPAPDLRFIQVVSATAHFEDGSSVPLNPFEICRSRVTTGQFEAFTAATGYVTSCERKGDGSFRFDETIEGVRPRDRGNTPLHSVSFEDAQAYCFWTGSRLPTEAELLAAALLDHRVMSPAERNEFMFGKSGRFDIERFPDALAGLGPEYVIGPAAPGKAVIRRGPYYVREVGWEKRRHREECSTDGYDLMVGFRVCRQTASS